MIMLAFCDKSFSLDIDPDRLANKVTYDSELATYVQH